MVPIGSLWREGSFLPAFEPLSSDLRTNTLVVGGGIAGILCAHMLQKAGVDCALVEAKNICGGVTENTTAKITLQHGLFCHSLLKTYGRERAGMYLRANQLALEAYARLCRGLDCEFERADNYVYSIHDRKSLELELSALRSLGVPALLEEAPPLPFATAGAVCVKDQARFNPLKFLGHIAKGLPIYEHSPVLELGPGWARTRGGMIRAENIIIATHFPILNKHGSYFLKLYQDRSYVLALEKAPDMEGMYVDSDDKGLSFRPQGELLLLGGGGHRTGKKGGGWRELQEFAASRYPEARIVRQWATQDCMSLDGIPYIGQYSRCTPGLYVLTGFNKWGMTGAMAGAMLLRDMILGRAPDWAEVFSPSRSMLHPQLAVNAGESALGLLRPTAPRCPHMGCALKYNSQEHSWDCPCHGSRFTKNGRLINNPATDGLK